jgi:hypothetical protein
MDRWAIEATISRLGRCLDERDFEGLRDLFTIDATVHTPGGAVTRHDALVGQARARHSNDQGTQHLITNVLIDAHGDHATIRPNLVVTFAKLGGQGTDRVSTPWRSQRTTWRSPALRGRVLDGGDDDGDRM